MTLIEVMAVVAVGAVIAAATTVNVVEQVRRVRAVDASRQALHPHLVARDRAAAARTCSETMLVPPIGQPFTPPVENGPPRFPAAAQTRIPRIAIIEWSACDDTALISRVEFFDLDGDITFAPYNSADGRAVFGPDGGLTSARPPAAAGGGVCLPGGGGGGGGGAPKPPAGGGGGGAPKPPAGGGGGGAVCLPPAPPAPPPDILFSATTYFGGVENYRISARAGTSQGSATEQAASPF